MAATSTFRTLTPRQTFATEIFEGDNQTYGVGMPLILTFSHPISDHRAVERSLELWTSKRVVGAWYWDGDTHALLPTARLLAGAHQGASGRPPGRRPGSARPLRRPHPHAELRDRTLADRRGRHAEPPRAHLPGPAPLRRLADELGAPRRRHPRRHLPDDRQGQSRRHDRAGLQHRGALVGEVHLERRFHARRLLVGG